VYRVELRPRAQREFDRLPRSDQVRLAAALTKLVDEPRSKQSVKLSGSIYRLRVGPFRIIYAVFDRDELVLVGKVSRREKDTYDRLEELF
jgi:mRNA-degrading endonuclease RelE of RelBE toxin-antitoxin system